MNTCVVMNYSNSISITHSEEIKRNNATDKFQEKQKCAVLKGRVVFMTELEYKFTNDALFKMVFCQYPDLLKRLVAMMIDVPKNGRV